MKKHIDKGISFVDDKEKMRDAAATLYCAAAESGICKDIEHGAEEVVKICRSWVLC